MLIMLQRAVWRCISLWKHLRMTPMITKVRAAIVKGKGTIFAALLYCW
jgi:hypothetical protein